MRLGKLLQAADGGDTLERTGAAVPQWLDYLLSDALFASFSETRAQATMVNRRGWDVGLLARLLAAEGEPDEGALQLVFERRELNEYVRDNCLAAPAGGGRAGRLHARACRAGGAIASAVVGQRQGAAGPAPGWRAGAGRPFCRHPGAPGRRWRQDRAHEAAPHLAAIPASAASSCCGNCWKRARRKSACRRPNCWDAAWGRNRRRCWKAHWRWKRANRCRRRSAMRCRGSARPAMRARMNCRWRRCRPRRRPPGSVTTRCNCCAPIMPRCWPSTASKRSRSARITSSGKHKYKWQQAAP